jgi:hypothetical protein
MFRVSLPLWRILPELRFVQFPWRWLFPLCAAATLLLALAIGQSNKGRFLWPAVALVLFAIDGGIIQTKEWFPHYADEIEANFQAGTGYAGLDEYAPLARRNDSLPIDPPLAAIVASEEQKFDGAGPSVTIERWSPEKKVILADLQEPMKINLKLLSYPAWQAKVNGKAAPLQENPETGQLMLLLPAGTSRTEIKFAQTWDRAAGIGISISSAAVLLVFWEFFAVSRKRSVNPHAAEVVPARAA